MRMTPSLAQLRTKELFPAYIPQGPTTLCEIPTRANNILEECDTIGKLFADLSYSVFSVFQQFLELAYIEETTDEELLPREGNELPKYVSEENFDNKC